MNTLRSKTSTRAAVKYLVHHILGGYQSSHEGLIQLRELGLATDQELVDQFMKNGERLIQRIIEFKLLQRMACILDRKSTRLNSSHVKISYAVFCLKKKHRS